MLNLQFKSFGRQIQRHLLTNLLFLEKISSGHCLRIHERSKAVKGLSKTKKSKLVRVEDDGYTVVYVPTEANCPVGVSTH